VALTVVAVAVTLAAYALTRPPKLPAVRWPALSGTILRREGGGPKRTQVWWRKTTWCSRNVGDARWATSYRNGLLSLSPAGDGKSAFEIAEGGGDGPVDGFGIAAAKQVTGDYRAKKATVTGSERIAGRDAFVVRESGRTVKTWWIDKRNGVTLGYRERQRNHDFSNWRFERVALGASAPPWTARDAEGVDPLAAGPFEIVSVAPASDPTGQNARIAPPEQHPAFADLAKRAFSVCRPGSPATVPSPAPSPGTAPGSG
jgi:hypothetical protein